MAKVVTELDIELAKWNAKTAQIKADMKKLSAEAKKENVGGAITGELSNAAAGALTFTAAFAGLKSLTNHFDEVHDAALKMGESTDVIQRVSFAASQSGSSMEGVASSFLKLEKALGDVENSGARQALADLGLTAEQLAAMPLDEKILALSGAFDQARENGTGVKDLMDLLGKSAGDLIPWLEEGRDRIKEMFEAAPALADDAVQALADLNDAIEGVGNQAYVMGGKVLIGLGMLATGLKQVVTGEAPTLDDAFDNMGAEMNARNEAGERKHPRRGRAANTESATAAAKAAKEEEDAAKKSAKEEEDRQKRIADLQRDIESRRISMLPDDQQLAEFKSKLQTMLEDVDFVDPSMHALQRQIDYAPTTEEQERLLKIQKEAMETQDKINQLTEKGQKTKTETVKTAQTPGSVTAAINTIFGRSANELILDESKRQTQVLERIDKSLSKIAGDGGDGMGGDPFDTFTF